MKKKKNNWKKKLIEAEIKRRKLLKNLEAKKRVNILSKHEDKIPNIIFKNGR